MQIANMLKAVSTAMLDAVHDVRELPNAFLEKDPAARSKAEVLLLYPGVRALVAHRFAHAFWQNNAHFLGRAIAEGARFFSGIEIHPGAKIGRKVVIDHGIGTVIGETAVVHDNVVIYQGVTLGGTQIAKQKRHPTILSGSVIGVGSVVLGDITVGPNARVGAGAVVVKSVAPSTSVGGIPADVLRPRYLKSVSSIDGGGI